jgi:hypothetical protein
LRWWWSSFPSIRPVIHPSKFLIPEEEDDGRGGGGKTPVVLQLQTNFKKLKIIEKKLRNKEEIFLKQHKKFQIKKEKNKLLTNK